MARDRCTLLKVISTPFQVKGEMPIKSFHEAARLQSCFGSKMVIRILFGIRMDYRYGKLFAMFFNGCCLGSQRLGLTYHPMMNSIWFFLPRWSKVVFGTMQARYRLHIEQTPTSYKRRTSFCPRKRREGDQIWTIPAEAFKSSRIGTRWSTW